jgi:hypothetical protein
MDLGGIGELDGECLAYEVLASYSRSICWEKFLGLLEVLLREVMRTRLLTFSATIWMGGFSGPLPIPRKLNEPYGDRPPVLLGNNSCSF